MEPEWLGVVDMMEVEDTGASTGIEVVHMETMELKGSTNEIESILRP